MTHEGEGDVRVSQKLGGTSGAGGNVPEEMSYTLRDRATTAMAILRNSVEHCLRHIQTS